jgi:hypothetical protein
MSKLLYSVKRGCMQMCVSHRRHLHKGRQGGKIRIFPQKDAVCEIWRMQIYRESFLRFIKFCVSIEYFWDFMLSLIFLFLTLNCLKTLFKHSVKLFKNLNNLVLFCILLANKWRSNVLKNIFKKSILNFRKILMFVWILKFETMRIDGSKYLVGNFECAAVCVLRNELKFGQHFPFNCVKTHLKTPAEKYILILTICILSSSLYIIHIIPVIKTHIRIYIYFKRNVCALIACKIFYADNAAICITSTLDIWIFSLGINDQFVSVRYTWINISVKAIFVKWTEKAWFVNYCSTARPRLLLMHIRIIILT